MTSHFGIVVVDSNKRGEGEALNDEEKRQICLDIETWLVEHSSEIGAAVQAAPSISAGALASLFADIGVSSPPADLATLLLWRDVALPLQDYVTLPSVAIRSSSLAIISEKRIAFACAAHQSLALPNHLVAFARNVDGDLLVLDSGAVREWSSASGPDDALAGRVVAPSIWILLERLRDGILAGKCEMLDDCFVESS